MQLIKLMRNTPPVQETKYNGSADKPPTPAAAPVFHGKFRTSEGWQLLVDVEDATETGDDDCPFRYKCYLAFSSDQTLCPLPFTVTDLDDFDATALAFVRNKFPLEVSRHQALQADLDALSEADTEISDYEAKSAPRKSASQKSSSRKPRKRGQHKRRSRHLEPYQQRAQNRAKKSR